MSLTVIALLVALFPHFFLELFRVLYFDLKFERFVEIINQSFKQKLSFAAIQYLPYLAQKSSPDLFTHGWLDNDDLSRITGCICMVVISIMSFPQCPHVFAHFLRIVFAVDARLQYTSSPAHLSGAASKHAAASVVVVVAILSWTGLLTGGWRDDSIVQQVKGHFWRIRFSYFSLMHRCLCLAQIGALSTSLSHLADVLPVNNRAVDVIVVVETLLQHGGWNFMFYSGTIFGSPIEL